MYVCVCGLCDCVYMYVCAGMCECVLCMAVPASKIEALADLCDVCIYHWHPMINDQGVIFGQINVMALHQVTSGYHRIH